MKAFILILFCASSAVAQTSDNNKIDQLITYLGKSKFTNTNINYYIYEVPEQLSKKDSSEINECLKTYKASDIVYSAINSWYNYVIPFAKTINSEKYYSFFDPIVNEKRKNYKNRVKHNLCISVSQIAFIPSEQILIVKIKTVSGNTVSSSCIFVFKYSESKILNQLTVLTCDFS